KLAVEFNWWILRASRSTITTSPSTCRTESPAGHRNATNQSFPEGIRASPEGMLRLRELFSATGPTLVRPQCCGKAVPRSSGRLLSTVYRLRHAQLRRRLGPDRALAGNLVAPALRPQPPPRGARGLLGDRDRDGPTSLRSGPGDPAIRPR